MDIVTAFVGLIQLLIAILLAVVALYIGYSVFSKITKGIDEIQELKKGNVAVALEMAGVIIAVAVIIQSGVIGITASIL